MFLLPLTAAGQWMPDDEPSWFESLAISKQNQICQIYGAPVQSGQELPKPLSSFISRPPAIQSRKFPAFLTAGPSTMTTTTIEWLLRKADPPFQQLLT